MASWYEDRDEDDFDDDGILEDDDEDRTIAAERHEELVEAHEHTWATVDNPEDFHDEAGHFGEGFGDDGGHEHDGDGDGPSGDGWREFADYKAQVEEHGYPVGGGEDELDDEWMDVDDPDEWAGDADAEENDELAESVAGPGAVSWYKNSDEDWSDEQLDEMRETIRHFNPDADPDWGVPQDVLADPEWEASGRDQGEYYRRKGWLDDDDEDGDDFADEPDDEDGGGGGFFSRIRGAFGGGSSDDGPDEPEVDELEVADEDTPDAGLADEANELSIEASERTLDEIDQDDPRGEELDEDVGETGPLNQL